MRFLLTIKKVVVLGVLAARLSPFAPLVVDAGAVGGAAPPAELLLFLDDEPLHRRPHHPGGPRRLVGPVPAAGCTGSLLQVGHVGVFQGRA